MKTICIRFGLNEFKKTEIGEKKKELKLLEEFINESKATEI